MKRLVSLVLALSLAGSVFAVEVVANGGAENWTAGSPDSWMFDNISATGVVNPVPGAFVISQNTTQQHGGASCIQMVNAASQWTYRYGLHTNSFTTMYGTGNNVSAWLYPTGNAANTRIARGYYFGGVWNVQTTVQIATSTLNAWNNLVEAGTWDFGGLPTRISVHVINAQTTLADDFSVDALVPVEVSAFTID